MDIVSVFEENKSLIETLMPFVSSLIGAVIGGMISIFTLFRNSKTIKKQLLVQTISEERIKWINSLRNEFVAYNTSLSMYQEATKNREKVEWKMGGQIGGELSSQSIYEQLITSIKK